MADTTVDADVYALSDTLGTSPRGPYWASPDIGAIILIDAAQDLRVWRTTDKGATWSETNLHTGTVLNVATWFDKETPGDFGTLLHITFGDDVAEDLHYLSYDLADGTIGTLRTINASIAMDGVNEGLSITKAVNGYLYVAFQLDGGTGFERSVDAGENWTSRTDPHEAAPDRIILFPADVDAGDVAGFYLDDSADDMSLKMYDDSANTWTETAVFTGTLIIPARQEFDGAIRLSDKHLITVSSNQFNNAANDFIAHDLTVDSIASPTVTALTNVTTDVNHNNPAIWIRHDTDAIRVAYLSGTFGLAQDVVYRESTDGGTTWGGEQAYSEDTADDIRWVNSGRGAFVTGGRFQPTWFNDDLNDVFVNETNDLEVEPRSPIPYVMVY